MNNKIVSHKKSVLYTAVYLTVISIIFFIIAATSIRDKYATIDEPIITASGNNCLNTQNNYINAENPPLFKSILALPTYFMALNPIKDS